VNARPPSALVTGITQGIGQALATALLQDGWVVWGTSRKSPDETAASIDSRLHDRLRPLHLELADLDACAAIGGRVSGPLDVLVNSAASFGNKAFRGGDFSPQAFLEALAINTVAPTAIARALKPRLDEGARRLIVMMSTGNASLSGNKTGGMLAYRASKSALNQVVRTLAAEWADGGFTTVALNPGWVRTAMGGNQAPLTPLTAAQNILSFVRTAGSQLNGCFVNTDGCPLPW
jgi:NAD(P)-dependent dehydrogenase (short-subunit alcohol dehydrogenase family)